jgi:hypothetical protein
MIEVDQAFVNKVRSRVDGCSSFCQLRQLLNQFSAYISNDQIRDSFKDRALDLPSLFGGDRETCNDFLEDLQLESEISFFAEDVVKKKVKKPYKREKKFVPKPINKQNINLQIEVYSREGKIYRDFEFALYKKVLTMTGGNKKEAAKLLGLSTASLNCSINTSSRLKDFLLRLKREKR